MIKNPDRRGGPPAVAVRLGRLPLSEVSPAELIARLEAAKEGSGELDSLVSETVFAAAGRGGMRLRTPEPVGRGAPLAELGADGRVRRYSRSLDAALTLVPEGWSWQIRVIRRSPLPVPINRAVVAHDRTGLVLASEHCEAEAQTPALALCIAALRARAAQAGR
jgi:hypothetical protein